jgi:SAM-dependent methyltransferase
MKELDNYEEELKQWSALEEAAANLLSNKLYKMYSPKTVIDIGCGSGLFLTPFMPHGVKVFGVDGEKTGGFLLDESEFKQADLREPQDFGKFDLAICLEVIEHLQPEYEDILVETIAKSADVIAFSGAKPGQVGTNHYNCQTQEYWREKFKAHGFEWSEDTLGLLDFMHSQPAFRNCPWLEENIMILKK